MFPHHMHTYPKVYPYKGSLSAFRSVAADVMMIIAASAPAEVNTEHNHELAAFVTRRIV